jgi:cytochrome c oxidase assembly protein subunit 19
MSFGRPPNIESSPGKAPLRGSFPLDHDGILKGLLALRFLINKLI